jgi:hypothetical protein
MLVFSLGSVTIYGAVAFGWVTWKVGTTFLVVPAASWLLIAVPVALAVKRR